MCADIFNSDKHTGVSGLNLCRCDRVGDDYGGDCAKNNIYSHQRNNIDRLILNVFGQSCSLITENCWHPVVPSCTWTELFTYNRKLLNGIQLYQVHHENMPI